MKDLIRILKSLISKRNIAGMCGLFALGLFFFSFNPFHFPTAPKKEVDIEKENPITLTKVMRSAESAKKEKYLVSASTPQFVLLSFDGSKSVDMLNEILAFKQRLKDEGKSVHFTYFINAAYFLGQGSAYLYQAPGEPPGKSMIGFSDYVKDIPLRVEGFNKALEMGDEVGSHLAGHFDGTNWSEADWKQEFNSFNLLLMNVQKNNPAVTIPKPNFGPDTIVGLRAPDLGVNRSLYKVLHDYHFLYDASGAASLSSRDNWPKKDVYGTWLVPLGRVSLGKSHISTISMDYNLWMMQSNVQEEAVKGTALWQKYYDDAVAAYMDYFNSNFNENRAPIVIGHHFNKWNDGVYWEAMKTFAENVCGREDVRCVTFKELVGYLNTEGVPPLIK
ncbi:MAG: hypothetical protein PHV93_02815 [Candidatus Pacebacteria bacterium]|nr:hypothetical protein [Candidatus Paceibacterota bacterium]